MRFGVLGTGTVGRTIATKLVSLGHEVTMGSRQERNERAVEWVRQTGANAAEGSFADAARFGEAVCNCTAGTASVQAVKRAGTEHFAGKILIDVANRLEMGHAGPQLVLGAVSLGEELQRELPEARVAKALNTVNHQLMVQPSLLAGSHSIFVAGDDPEAKVQVAALLQSFGWPPIQLWRVTQAARFIKVIQ